MQYTRAERTALENALSAGEAPKCPACGSAVSAQPVAVPPDVSYVRHRIWIFCPQCKRTAAVDKSRPNTSTQ